MKLGTLQNLQGQLRPEAWLAAMGAALVLTALAAWLYLFKPEFGRYRELAASWSPEATLDAELRSQTTQQEIARLEALLAELRDRVYGGASGLPREQMEAHIVARLDELSAERGVRLTRVKPGLPGRVLEFEELPYDVDVSGEYFALYEWMRSVEDELRPLVVKRFQLTPTPGSDQVRMQLRLVSYRPPEETG